MEDCRQVAAFLYGDEFWYGDPLREVHGLSEDQLFWVPHPKGLCALWHVGHVAHRERTHIAGFLQGLEGELLPKHPEEGPVILNLQCYGVLI